MKKKKKTIFDFNIVLKYPSEVCKKDRELEEIPPQELNLFLSEFIIATRTKKGEQYEPTAQRNLKERWPLSYKAWIWEKAVYSSRIYEIQRRIESKAKRTEKKMAEGINRRQPLLFRMRKSIFSLKKKRLGNKFSVVATEHSLAE